MAHSSKDYNTERWYKSENVYLFYLQITCTAKFLKLLLGELTTPSMIIERLKNLLCYAKIRNSLYGSVIIIGELLQILKSWRKSEEKVQKIWSAKNVYVHIRAGKNFCAITGWARVEIECSNNSDNIVSRGLTIVMNWNFFSGWETGLWLGIRKVFGSGLKLFSRFF